MSGSASRASTAAVTAAPFMKARERPSALAARRTRQLPSDSVSNASCSPSTASACGCAETSNSALTSQPVVPGRIFDLCTRAPSTSESASSKIDLPAPDSPVITVRPGPNSMSSRSTSTKLRTVRALSTRKRRGAVAWWGSGRLRQRRAWREGILPFLAPQGADRGLKKCALSAPREQNAVPPRPPS